jgi:hypothetical protein
MYQPAPLKLRRGAVSGRSSTPPHLGHLVSGSAEKFWIFSNLWPHWVQRYAYNGKASDLQGEIQTLNPFYPPGTCGGAGAGYALALAWLPPILATK